MFDSSRMERGSRDMIMSSYPESGSADLLSEILAQLTEGVATLTEDGIVVSWNPRAASLTGYTLAEINAVGLVQIFDVPDDMVRLLHAAQRASPPPSERLVLKRANGQRIPVDVRCSPLRHMGRTQGRLVMVMRDLSELETLQHRLLQSERLSILGRLAGVVSHEIRDPLAAIFLHADILQDDMRQLVGRNHEQVWRSLSAIKEEVARLHDLVQQYLSLARLPELRHEPVELRAYLHAFGAEMQERLAVRGITWRLDGDRDLGWVALHQNSFRRVLLNMLNNAVEAMPQGGILTLRGQRLAHRVRLEVSDTGCGIPPEQLPLLFSPLHSTKPEGTGLGLYLVREIVTAHQGEMAVSSEPGVGTTFTLTLPLLDNKALQEPREAEETGTDGAPSCR